MLWQWTINKYTEGTTFAGMYYMEMGMAPQSYAGTINEINTTITNEKWVDDNYYYTDNNNPKIKYVLKSGKYYFVEPIRWIILEDGNYTNDETGVYGMDYFAKKNISADNLTSNQILVVSEKLLMNGNFNDAKGNTLNTLKTKIFTPSEKNLLNTIQLITGNNVENKDFFITGYTNENDNFKLTSLLTSNVLRKAYYTSYLAASTTKPTTSKEYWTRYSFAAGSVRYHFINSDGVAEQKTNWGANIYGIRPMFVVDKFEYIN